MARGKESENRTNKLFFFFPRAANRERGRKQSFRSFPSFLFARNKRQKFSPSYKKKSFVSHSKKRSQTQITEDEAEKDRKRRRENGAENTREIRWGVVRGEERRGAAQKKPRALSSDALVPRPTTAVTLSPLSSRSASFRAFSSANLLRALATALALQAPHALLAPLLIHCFFCQWRSRSEGF